MWGITFPSSEHAYVAAKTTDRNLQIQISKIKKPSDVKRFGRSIELRDDWEDVKVLLMLEILIAKFSQNKNLLVKLQEIPDEELVEVNEWGDTFWGICNNNGFNILGRLLQVVKRII